VLRRGRQGGRLKKGRGDTDQAAWRRYCHDNYYKAAKMERVASVSRAAGGRREEVE